MIDLMRKAGLRRALVSSSNDEGTRRLYDAAPDLVVPSLRPYRSRGEISTWARDPSIVTHLEARLARYRYAAIGEFHPYGADTDLPVPTRMIELARQHGLILHAHSDADAIDRIFRQWPQARVIWAHSGFDRPASVREVLRRHPTLMADLAFRSDMATGSAASGSRVEYPNGRRCFSRCRSASWSAPTPSPRSACTSSDRMPTSRAHGWQDCHQRYDSRSPGAMPSDSSAGLGGKSGSPLRRSTGGTGNSNGDGDSNGHGGERGRKQDRDTERFAALPHRCRGHAGRGPPGRAVLPHGTRHRHRHSHSG